LNICQAADRRPASFPESEYPIMTCKCKANGDNLRPAYPWSTTHQKNLHSSCLPIDFSEVAVLKRK
jgi:hypothetical protein